MNGMAFYPSMGKMERYRIDPVSFETVTAQCTNRDCGRALNAEIAGVAVSLSWNALRVLCALCVETSYRAVRSIPVIDAATCKVRGSKTYRFDSTAMT